MLKDALDKALEFEKEISLLYLEQGQVSTNLLVQKLFFTLAQQEIDHMMSITELLSSQTGQPAAGRVPEAANLETEMRGFFERFNGKTMKGDASNVDAVEMAIEVEKEGYEMYRTFLADKDGDEKDREFFGQILEQEGKHLESLQNLHYFLTGAGDWLQQNESQVWNWMNL